MSFLVEKLIDIHFNGQLSLYLSNKIEKEKYTIFYSNIIKDQYWNLAYIKDNKVEIKSLYNQIKVDMERLNRKPLIYIISNILDDKLEKQLKDSKLKVIYTDVWMIMENIEEFKNYKSKVEFSVQKVEESLEKRFIQSVMDGFSGDNPEDPYESLSDDYRIALKESFKKNNSEYQIQHYLGIKEDESVSTATVVYKKDKAIIYNITTNKKYQKQGICKQMIFEIIQDLIILGIKTICLQTEQGYYTEQVYKKMGFKEIMIGKAYREE